MIPAELPSLSYANADFLTDRLLVGGDLDYRLAEDARRQLDELCEHGVTHIVDVRVEWSDRDWVAEIRPGLRYLHHGVDDAGQQIPAAWFDTAVDWAVEAIEAGGVVLAHCHMGINRGPSLAFAILLRLGWDPVEALTLIRTARPVAYVAYAEDALAWHHAENRIALLCDLERVAQWRRAHNMDVTEVIRLRRIEEGSG